VNSPFDVVVAGAGPAGAATALRLARAGFRVAAVDRAVFPRDKICSEYMSPEGVRHLDTLGLLANVERQGGCAIRGTTVFAARGSSLTGLFARTAPPPFRETGLSVSRRILDQALVTAARQAGVEVMERTTVVSVLRQRKGLAGLQIRDQNDRVRELPARLTVGADGLRSQVARAMNVRRTGRLRRYAFVAHVAGVSGLRDTAELHVGADGYVGLNPLGGGVANVALVVPQDRARRAGGRTEAFFIEELARFPGVRDRVRRDAIVREVLVTGPFAAWSKSVVMPGGLLVGDAADFFDPFTGEGICAALRGAELVEDVARAALERPGIAPAAALRPYIAARRRAFFGKWVVERAIGYAMLAPALFDRAVARLERRGLAHTLIGVTGDFVPPSAVLNPVFLSQVVF
jgi:flavin-dependent dehydrogenase